MSFWTPLEDDILIKMVNEHKDVNEIVTLFDNRGRDSVAGRIRRLRADGKLPLLPGTKSKSVTKKAKPPSKPPKPAKPKEPPYIPPERPLHPLELLGSFDCRWPIGDPGTVGFRFCAEPIKHGSPYCPDHAERAFTGTGRMSREDKVMEPAD